MPRMRVEPVDGTKPCSTCGLIKPLSDFNKKAKAACGYASQCQECARQAQRAYKLAHPDRVQEARERWAATHPDYDREYSARRAKNASRQPEVRSEVEKARRAARTDEQKERDRERARAYRLAHLDKVRENGRKSAARRKERIAARLESWSKLNRQRRREARVETVRLEVLIDRDKGMCGICQSPVLPGQHSIDHILPIAEGGEHSYANTRLAHLRCNQQRLHLGSAQLRMLG